MKKLTTTALAALALATIIPTSAKADDPVNPVQGAVCNLYSLEDLISDEKAFSDFAASIDKTPALATFVDTASEYKCVEKKDGVNSNCGMWKGWIKQTKAGTYTFTCTSNDYEDCRYTIWINGARCINAVYGQHAFNVELEAGFNFIKIVVEARDEPFTLTYKKAGSVKEPISCGPENMFYDDDDE